MNLFQFINRQKRWSSNTFGDTPRTEGILKHIEKECNEVRQAPADLKEWIDIVILALDGAWRAGHSPAAICQMLQEKQAINMTREYPKTPDDQPSEHVREPYQSRGRPPLSDELEEASRNIRELVEKAAEELMKEKSEQNRRLLSLDGILEEGVITKLIMLNQKSSAPKHLVSWGCFHGDVFVQYLENDPCEYQYTAINVKLSEFIVKLPFKAVAAVSEDIVLVRRKI